MSTAKTDSFSYLDHSLSFKVKKVLRYVALDGVSKTVAKVKAQYHMVRTEGFEGARWMNPACKSPDAKGRFVGVIGSGKFAHSMVSFYAAKVDSRFLRAAYDLNRARARSLVSDYGAVYAAGTPEELINDPKIKLVYIASNHAMHAEYAIQCLDAGKSVHIEKPQVVTDDQLERLIAAQARNPNCMVFLGFNRPRSPHFKTIQDVFAKQPGTLMVNWFIAGHEMPADNWYFSPAEGGRVLGNLCHWTDLTLSMVGVDKAFPCEIVPACPPNTMSDFCVGIKFNDASLAGITFSAKGHTFEGVHEKLNAHKGDAIVSLIDFKDTTIEVVEKKKTFSTRHRNHGHSENIVNSYIAVRDNDRSRAIDIKYNKATALIFLAVKRAIEEGRNVQVTLD